MTNFFESASFMLPSQVKSDVAGRMKETKGIKSVELQLKGESLTNAKEFSRMLVALKKRGVKISHEVNIKLDFPRTISREKALMLVENMPTSKNGTLKVRLELTREAHAPSEA